jgi:hypothetical protein
VNRHESGCVCWTERTRVQHVPICWIHLWEETVCSSPFPSPFPPYSVFLHFMIVSDSRPIQSLLCSDASNAVYGTLVVTSRNILLVSKSSAIRFPLSFVDHAVNMRVKKVRGLQSRVHMIGLFPSKMEQIEGGSFSVTKKDVWKGSPNHHIFIIITHVLICNSLIR